MTGADPDSAAATPRAQSNVIGVALLLGIAVIGIAGLTAGIGAIVDDNAATADATSVADGFDSALQPRETNGRHVGHVRFSDGALRTESRTLRILDGSGVEETVEVDALVFEAGERRVAYHAGSIVRGAPGSAWFHREPSITATRDPEGVLVVSAPRLDAAPVSTAGTARSLRLTTDVTHDRRALDAGEYAVAVETPTPGPWRRYFEDLDAAVETSERRFDGDEASSVVARFDGDRSAYLVVHDMDLEVGRG